MSALFDDIHALWALLGIAIAVGVAMAAFWALDLRIKRTYDPDPLIAGPMELASEVASLQEQRVEYWQDQFRRESDQRAEWRAEFQAEQVRTTARDEQVAYWRTQAEECQEALAAERSR